MSKRNKNSGRNTGYKSLPIFGSTEDGKIVLGGVYDIHEVYGMPLSPLFSYLADHNAVPDWIDLYKSAERNGMKHFQILYKIKDSIEDAWGKDFANIVCDRLTIWKAAKIKEHS